MKLRHALALACFVLSGVAGLIYEITWIRKAALVFGSTTHALSTVLAVFFLGLAIGSYLFGRFSRHMERPLVAYAVLELALGVLAALTIPEFAFVDPRFGEVYRATGGDAASLWLARFGLVSLVLLPPTILMGGTLPLFCRQFVLDRARIAGSVGFLYGANTLGAAAGCLLAGFWMIPAFGVQASILVAAAINMVAGLTVSALGLARQRVPVRDGEGAAGAKRTRTAPAKLPRRARMEPPTPARGERPRARATAALRVWVSALFFFTGFAVLGHEVLWTRFVALLIHNTVHTYTLTLGMVLIGIVIGSVIASRFLDRARSRPRVLGWLQVGLGVSVMAFMMLPPSLWEHLDSLAVIAALLLLPAVLSGASFPLVVRMVVDDPELAGEGVGTMSAINIVGGIAGSLAIGFVVLPGLGLETAARLTTGVSLAIGVVAFVVLDRDGPPVLRWGAALAGVTLWLAIPAWFGTRLPQDFLADRAELVDYREGLESNLAVLRREGTTQLEIDRWWQGEARKTHQVMAAHVPMLLHCAPRLVLLVGVGAGQTPERILMYDVDRLDCVDIEPAVFDIIRPHFSSNWMDDPRVRLIRADGRNVIAHTAERYDVVSLELGQVFRPGVAAFYTEDFYRQVRTRLRPGGLVSQFVPIPFLSPDMLKGIVHTFLQVFPASVLWYNTSELLLIGFEAELPEVDLDRLRLLDANARVHEDLRYSQWGGERYWLNQRDVFLGGALCGPQGLAAFAADGQVFRDDRPVLAYRAAGVSTRRGSENERAFLVAIGPHVEPVSRALGVAIDSDEARRVEGVQQANLGDIATSATLREFDAVRNVWPPERLLSLAERGLRSNPDNAAANRVTGDVLMLLGRLSEAQRLLAHAVALDRADGRARRSLAIVLHRLGREREAVPQYRAALALRADAETHANLGLALLAIGDSAGARIEFGEAVRMDPGLTLARRGLEQVR